MSDFSTTDSEEYEVWLENAEALLENLPTEETIVLNVLKEKISFREDSAGVVTVRWNDEFVTMVDNAKSLLARMENYFEDRYTDEDGNVRQSFIYLIFHNLFGDDD